MRDTFDKKLWEIITSILMFYFLFLCLEYFTNKATFWRWLIYGILISTSILLGIVCWNKWREHKERKILERLMEEVFKASQEDYIKNFINRFGLEGRGILDWSFRKHRFEAERIDDLERYLLEKNINLRTDKSHRDIYTLLRYYIQQKEEKLTRESIKKELQKFASLTGPEFEKLLYRLYTKMGYSVELVGESGDQGGDLIANKDGERLLIQAKCYRDWSTGNGAVQQVVAAMKYYDCRKASVVTTSYFTSEAITLAKVNYTELISKDRLQKMLLDYLGESWD